MQSCGPEHSEHPECTGGQFETSIEIMQAEIQSVVGDNWERQVRNHSDPSTQSIQSVLGDEWETSLKSCWQRIQSPECSGGQLGDKCEIMRTKALRESRVSFAGKQARRQTPNHAARACTRFKGVGTPHRYTCLGN